MGCGASTAIATGPVVIEHQRDPEDHSLEPLQLQMTNIEEFDAVFARLQELLNSLVDLNNGVNEAVAEVKVAYAAASSAFELQVSFGPCTDVVLLDLLSGKERPAAATVQQLLDDPALSAADAELAFARVALHEWLVASDTPVSLRIARDGSLELKDSKLAAPSQLQHFNACLAKLRAALGSRASVTVAVKPGTTFPSTTINAQIGRRASPGGKLEPVPLLVVCASACAASIMEAEAFLADRAQHLAIRVKGLDLEWKLLSGYRAGLVTEIANDETREKVEEAVAAINVALFKLMNAGASAREPASLSNAVLEVVRPVLDLVKKANGGNKGWLTIRPEVEFRKDEADGSPPVFDFHLNVELSPAARIPPFPQCLPEKTSELLTSLLNLKDVIAEALNDLPPISEEVDASLEEAKEFYELCPDAAAKKGLTMMEAVKSSKATGSNLRALYSTQELFLAFGENVKRVADELASSAAAVEALIGKAFPS